MMRHDYVIDQAVVDLLAATLQQKFDYLFNPEMSWHVANVAARELVRIQETTGKDLTIRSDVE